MVDDIEDHVEESIDAILKLQNEFNKFTYEQEERH